MSGWAALAQVGSEIGQMAYQDYAQRRANKWNVQLARENRDWQEKMSNTQFQRSAQDLEAAGLNRVLAIGQPSPSPTPNLPHVESQGKNVSKMDMMSIASAKASIENLQAQKSLTEANTRKADAEAAQAEVLKGIYEALGPSAQKFFDAVPGMINNAKDAAPSVGQKWQRGIDVIGKTIKDKYESFNNSAKDVIQDVGKKFDDLKHLKPMRLEPKADRKKLREELKDLPYHEIQKRYRRIFND